MTVPGLAACLVLMAVSLAACQSADSGTGGQKENIAAVREQDGAGQTNQDNHAAKEENAREMCIRDRGQHIGGIDQYGLKHAGQAQTFVRYEIVKPVNHGPVPKLVDIPDSHAEICA